MNQQQRDLLARVLDMTETELRAAMIGIVNDAYGKNVTPLFGEAVAQNIDAAYNPIRRKGVRFSDK